jgi:tRNA A-37 threonylcarbamoyl transferase component Bud32
MAIMSADHTPAGDDPRPTRPLRRDPRVGALDEELSGYQIHERIGAGGMGIVYRAHDADGREVAIKVLRHDIADDPRARDRLAREVASQRLVHNPNIARILDAELDSPDDAFVVTEFIPGPTLDTAVRSRGGLHPELVRELGLVLGQALQAIHGVGVVHRDLKPSNVLLRDARDGDLDDFDPEGDRLDPVIIDFGIAIAAEQSRMTSTGLVMGTSAYLDPQIMRTNETGEAGDWWSFAALLAFAATGREPFGSGRADVVLLRAERQEIDVEGAPTELAAWLRHALRPDPSDRPTPQEMLERLGELDLELYDEAGETEAIDTAAPTEALAAGGAAAGSGIHGDTAETADASGTEDGGDGQGGASADETEAFAAGAADDADRTQALSSADDADRTQMLPAEGDGDRTQMLPAAGAEDAEDDARPTEAFPVDDWQEDRPTEAFPAVPEPTRRLPVMQSPPASPGSAQQSPQQQGPGHVRQDLQQPAPYAQTPSQAPIPPPGTVPLGYLQPQPEAGQFPPAYAPWQPPPPPRRTVLVWLGNALLVGLGAIAPYISLVLLLLLGGLARTWEQSHRAFENRRARGGSVGAARGAVGAAAVFRFVGGVLITALQALFPLILGLLVGLAADAVLVVTGGSSLPDAAVFAITMAITVLLVWVGIGARTTRDGAHRVVDAAAPDRVWTAVVGGLLLLLLVAVGFVVLTRGGVVDYMPLSTWFTIDDIALWRRW